MGEDTLFYQFKQALEQKAPLKIYGRGINHIPTIHVDDLAQLAYDIDFSNIDGHHFAVDHSRIKQRELVEAISQTIGNGNIE
jgi:nucleoside-diphosphate-sugar epimerase